ncbi:threonylcarbamoyl-AMP synthase [Ktedonosporobacter rubrisoli]|uniref:Threonylcarbamoyl-AMP synthase n=1 Tax=Ktedonosporobacter rubrisoli TaxID=2509675 RepID=A0A4P6K390_KTERU|nr:L-threonylcarbamoyladenylate synthase [Ktedonosporobacter rubrisoli]QBD82639.1 threonylcarbamoyl-AMP synthase [Ktedonosporobacter rubrisoli]
MQDKSTEVLQVSARQPEPAIIERAAALLRAGEIVVFPTETVYGLGGDALQPRALESIFAAKGRPLNDPLILHIAEEHDLEMIVTQVPPQAHQLIRVFWPGPLTLILPASERVPRLATAGLPTVAVRMPGHPVSRALIQATGSPIAAPSANRFMHVSPTSAQHALADLHGRVPLILDGGACQVGVESTILDLSAEQPTILRPGGVSLEALRTVLPTIKLLPKLKASDDQESEAKKAPGQMSVHYSPAVPALLFEGSEEEMRANMLAEIRRYQAQGQAVGVLIADEDRIPFQGSGAHVYSLGSSTHPEQIAGRLYAGLRTLEEAGVSIILCRNFTEQGLGLAVRDRLSKATGGNIFRRQ